MRGRSTGAKAAPLGGRTGLTSPRRQPKAGRKQVAKGGQKAFQAGGNSLVATTRWEGPRQTEDLGGDRGELCARARGIHGRGADTSRKHIF